MRKHGMLLTMIAAVLLVALCMGALELSKQVLPDYQNTVEEISLSENQSILTVNNRKATSLYPWDIYESAKENSQIKPVVSYDFDTVFPDKYFAQMISIFSPWIMNSYDSVDWHQHMEYVDDGKNFITHKKREERKMEQIDYNEINNGVDESRSVVCLCRDDFSLLESRE